jgi:hypothetical protein
MGKQRANNKVLIKTVFSEPVDSGIVPLVNNTIEQFCCDTEQSSTHCSYAESAGGFCSGNPSSRRYGPYSMPIHSHWWTA